MPKIRAEKNLIISSTKKGKIRNCWCVKDTLENLQIPNNSSGKPKEFTTRVNIKRIKFFLASNINILFSLLNNYLHCAFHSIPFIPQITFILVNFIFLTHFCTFFTFNIMKKNVVYNAQQLQQYFLLTSHSMMNKKNCKIYGQEEDFYINLWVALIVTVIVPYFFCYERKIEFIVVQTEEDWGRKKVWNWIFWRFYVSH